jgi:hypothetical protein
MFSGVLPPNKAFFRSLFSRCGNVNDRKQMPQGLKPIFF